MTMRAHHILRHCAGTPDPIAERARARARPAGSTIVAQRLGLGALILGLVSGCGGAPPAPPATPAPAPSSSPQAPAESGYSPFTDPMYLTFQNETNVYSRRTLARLWVLAAGLDRPGAARDARQKEAGQALAEAESAAGTQKDPCASGVGAALERANATKGRLERQYLSVSETEGAESEQARAIDGQVHLLRDEIEDLGKLAEPCRPAMFPDSDYQPQ